MTYMNDKSFFAGECTAFLSINKGENNCSIVSMMCDGADYPSSSVQMVLPKDVEANLLAVICANKIKSTDKKAGVKKSEIKELVSLLANTDTTLAIRKQNINGTMQNSYLLLTKAEKFATTPEEKQAKIFDANGSTYFKEVLQVAHNALSAEKEHASILLA